MAEIEESLRGQAEIWQNMFGFAASMALKCAVELRIADIINSHGRPLTLSQIAADITDSPSPDISYLKRIMRLLVHKNIFSADHPSDGGETLYGLTHSSKWIFRDSTTPSMASFVLLENHPVMLNPWHVLSQCVKDGGVAFDKVNGGEFWDFVANNPSFDKLFTNGMSCTSDVVMGAFLPAYKNELASIGSLVDVGGRIGAAVYEIVKSHPHIKGINFDLPHVVALAPDYEGVTHVGGSMFESIPKADAVFMKWIMHDWNEEDCVKILKNCKKAIPEKKGKVIILDIVLESSEGDNMFGEARLAFDLVMLAHNAGGKERTEKEWKRLLNDGGFPRYKIINIPSMLSIIEAYPE